MYVLMLTCCYLHPYKAWGVSNFGIMDTFKIHIRPELQCHI